MENDGSCHCRVAAGGSVATSRGPLRRRRHQTSSDPDRRVVCQQAVPMSGWVEGRPGEEEALSDLRESLLPGGQLDCPQQGSHGGKALRVPRL